MIFKNNKFSGLIIIKTSPNVDDRGYFQELFRLNELEKRVGHKINFCQENESESTIGVLRGLHFQKKPYSQSKLVRVSEGSILDVVVDLRKDSLTYGKHFSIELSSKNNLQLFVPKGFAHGYLTLTDTAKIIYKVDNYYNKKSECGIRYDDEFLDIKWGCATNFIVSAKDRNQSFFKDIE